MSLIRELFIISEADKMVGKAASVYHRDYVKTKKKPYRKYDPRNRKKQLGESLESGDIDKALDMLGAPDANEHGLRRDLKVLKTLRDSTSPESISIKKSDNGHRAVLSYDNNPQKAHDLFTKFKQTFGEPSNKSTSLANTVAKFHCKHTGTDIVLTHGKGKHITAVFKMKTGNTVNEGSNTFIAFLIEDPIPDEGDPLAMPFQDDAMTNKLLYLRDAVMQRLNSDDRAKALFDSSVDIEQAKQRLAVIIKTLPQSQKLMPTEIEQVAEEIAAVYWNR